MTYMVVTSPLRARNNNSFGMLPSRFRCRRLTLALATPTSSSLISMGDYQIACWLVFGIRVEVFIRHKIPCLLPPSSL